MESRTDGFRAVVVPERHDVAKNRIYSRRNGARFQPEGSELDASTPVEVAGVDVDLVQMASNQDPLF